jgi:hypothetical protein
MQFVVAARQIRHFTLAKFCKSVAWYIIHIARLRLCDPSPEARLQTCMSAPLTIFQIQPRPNHCTSSILDYSNDRKQTPASTTSTTNSTSTAQ